MWKQGIFAAYLIAALDLVAVGLFMPFITREIKSLGASLVTAGIIESTYGAIQLFSSPVVGRLSDTYGRKLVLMIMLTASSIAYVIQGSATSLSIFLLGRSLAGLTIYFLMAVDVISTGLFKHTQTLGKAVVADLAPEDKARVIGNINAFANMGYMIGPAVGGHLLNHEHGFRHACYIAAMFFLLNIGILSISVPESMSVRSTRETTPLSTSESTPLLESVQSNGKPQKQAITCFQPLKRRALFRIDLGTLTKTSLAAILLVRFLFGFALLVSRINLPIVLDSKFEASVVSVGYLISAEALVGTVLGFTVAPVIKHCYKERYQQMMVHMGIFQTIFLFVFFISPSFWVAATALIILSGIHPYQRVGVATLSLADTPDPGAILGLGQTATSLARMMAPIVAGLAQSLSNDGPALCGTVSALTALVVTIFAIPKSNEQESLEPSSMLLDESV